MEEVLYYSGGCAEYERKRKIEVISSMEEAVLMVLKDIN